MLTFYISGWRTDVETFNFQQHSIRHRLTTDVKCRFPLMLKLPFPVVILLWGRVVWEMKWMKVERGVNVWWGVWRKSSATSAGRKKFWGTLALNLGFLTMINVLANIFGMELNYHVRICYTHFKIHKLHDSLHLSRYIK